jgi:hypothetical protein
MVSHHTRHAHDSRWVTLYPEQMPTFSALEFVEHSAVSRSRRDVEFGRRGAQSPIERSRDHRAPLSQATLSTCSGYHGYHGCLVRVG